MPSSAYSEAALERRRERQACAQGFPGRLEDWRDAVGRSVAGVVEAGEARAVVFTDGAFLVAGPGPSGADALLGLLLAARPLLAEHHPEALAELDRRVAAEREAMRLARMEKVLGAVEQNMPRIPELREELRRLLDSG